MLLLLWFPPDTMAARQEQELLYFDIPRDRADRALTLFAEQARITFIFPFDIAKGIQTNAIAGRFTAEAAVGRLLEGTGLHPRFDAGGNLRIELSETRENEMNSSSKSIAAMLAGLFLNQAGAAEEPAPRAERIEEIVVRAQIRDENYQDVPVSGTVFDAYTIDENRLLDLEDVARYTPGFTASYFNYSSPNFSVRGAMNTFSQAGAGKPVGVFVDDVFVPRNSAAAFELFDIRQLSVLRGPQGTLFGRNVTGGAIQIYTSEPSFSETELRLRTGVGNYDYREFSGFASGPLSDSVAGKLSLSLKRREGFAKDRFLDRELEDLDSFNLRSGLSFIPSDTLNIRLSADFSRDSNNGKSYSFISDNAGTDFTGNDGDPRTAELGFPQSFERDIAGVSAHVDWHPGAGRFQSITALRESDTRERYSLGAADVRLPSVSTQFLKDERDEPRSFSQELRYISETGSRLDYVIGAYFYDESTERFVGDVLLGAGGNARFVDRDFAVTADTRSTALYASATLHLTEQLALGLGGRYTDEEKDIGVRFSDNNNAGNDFNTSPSSGFTEFTPRVTLSWYPNDSVTLFASRTEGFTAGGFNTETNDIDAIELGFRPETITAWELGAKTEWGDGRLILNSTLFRQEYEDKQEGFLLPGSFFSIFNAAQATIEGLELESALRLSDFLFLRANYSYLDAVYDEFVIPGGDDYSGNRLQTAPKNSYSLLVDYERPVAGGTGSLGLGYTWQGEYYTGASNVPEFLIDSYGLFNARLGYSWDAGRWSLSLWGKNLGDEDFVRIRGTSGAIGEFYGPPRTFGLSLTYQNL